MSDIEAANQFRADIICAYMEYQERQAELHHIQTAELVTIPDFCQAYEIFGIGKAEIREFLEYLRDKTNVRFEIHQEDYFKTLLPPRVIQIYFDEIFTEIRRKGETDWHKNETRLF